MTKVRVSRRVATAIKAVAGTGSGPAGPQGPEGPAGIQGPQGTAGTNGTNGQGVPVGGTTNQVLTKNSNTDFDTGWVTPSGGSGGSSPIIYWMI